MKEVILNPIPEFTDEEEYIRWEIQKLFKKYLYEPLIEGLLPKEDVIHNEDISSHLKRVLKSGRIRYWRGVFKGKFSSTTSRELKRLGAKWDAKQGGFRLLLSDMPSDLRLAIDLADEKHLRMVKKIDKRLREVIPAQIAKRLVLNKIFDLAIRKVEQDLQKQLKAITVMPTLTKEQRQKIADEYTNNMRLDIKGWTEQEVVKLRKKVRKVAMQGGRYENIIKTIERSYGVSQNKAKFLARQETNLLMSKFAESRYRDAGSTEYIWQTVIGSPKHPVRPMHKALKGTRQNWKNPPIVNKKGDRKHPGEDYNCRCKARPIIRF